MQQNKRDEKQQKPDWQRARYDSKHMRVKLRAPQASGWVI